MFSPEFQDECYDKPKQMPTEHKTRTKNKCSS